MMTPDSSIVIPALDSSHEAHEPAAAFIQDAGELPLIAHVALESYHVLTRVRPYRRLPPAAVARAIRDSFPGPLVGLEPEEQLVLMERAPRLGIVGGAIFDAAIATAARSAGLKLVSRDLRAAATYAAIGVDCELLPGSTS
jgi:predicted nucleic acid-binding protein